MIKDKFLNAIKEYFPESDVNAFNALISKQLLSKYCIELPQTVLNQARNIVESCFNLSRLPEYSTFLNDEKQLLKLTTPENSGICMSYDFHWDGQNLKLIEINTNAAFLLMSFFLYRAQGIYDPLVETIPDNLINSVQNEFHQTQINQTNRLNKIAIVDETPQLQKLYAEFLLFKQLFVKFELSCSIVDILELVPKEFDFIYNRCTDFYLMASESQTLRQEFNRKSICLSPNPYEYFLLADKHRLVEWNSAHFSTFSKQFSPLLENIAPYLLSAWLLTEETRDFIWSKRKSLFIKPLRSYGSKQTYRGESISRKVFEQLVNQGFIAQQFIPAPELEFSDGEINNKLKYDLRFYAYEDKIQGYVARLYQGQTTNLKTLNGGFAPIVFL